MEKTFKTNFLINLIVITCLSIIYIFPVSSNFSLSVSSHGDIYYYTRLVIFPLSIFSLFKLHNRNKIELLEYLFLILLTILSYVINNEIPWTSILILSSLILFDSLLKCNINYNIIHKKVIIASIFLLFQILIMFVVNRNHIGVIGFFKDANYTGYFLFIMYFLFGNPTDKKKFQFRDIFLVLAFLTFSRTAMICVIFTYFIRFSKISFKMIVNKPKLCFYLTFLLWIIICNFYVRYFESSTYIYSFNTGIDRLSNFVDYSNYIRSIINIKLIKNFNVSTLLFGFNDNLYKSLIFFEGKNANPHNLFFAVYQQSGVFFSIFLIRRFTNIFLKETKLFDMYVVFLIYAMILGPSIYYGVDLILIYIASRMYSSNKFPLEVNNETNT